MSCEGTETHIPVGPWGGQNGAKWDDGGYNTVRQLVICHGAAIDSIQIEYDKNGSSVWSDKHGGTGGIKTNKVKLDSPEEYLVSISGYYGSIVEYGPVLVRSLAFESNKKKYGPFGIQHGTHFSFPLNVGKVVGFHGRSSWQIDSIGVYLKPFLHRNQSNGPIINPPSIIDTTYDRQSGYKNKGPGDLEVETKTNSGFVNSSKITDRPFVNWPGFGGSTVLDLQVEKRTNVGIIHDAIIYGPANPPRISVLVPRGPRVGEGFGYDIEKSGNIAEVIDTAITRGPMNHPTKSVPPMFDYEMENDSNISVPLVSVSQPKGLSNWAVTSPNKVASYGPWGGGGGARFDDGVHGGVREVHVTRCEGLVSIRACYDSNGQVLWGCIHGGTAGIRLDKIAFDYPSEVLTHVTGYYGPAGLRGPVVVKSLTLYTNKTKYGPFGEEQGTYFSSPSNKGRIVGFHGRQGLFIDSIGVYVIEEPARLYNSSASISYDSFTMRDAKPYEMPRARMVKEPVAMSSGPWGGIGGKPWDDGLFSGVKSIYVTKGEAIYCIQIEYDRNGQPVWSPRHGGGCERDSQTIKLDYPNEVLSGVSGSYESLSGNDTKYVIKSLTFYTNKGKHGPYGEESGIFFSSNKSEGRIVGFHGRSGCYLNSIGVHVK